MGTTPNAKRLLWAGFFSIFAAGVGFSVRAGILGAWGSEYGFTQTELGDITGYALGGFGIVVLLGMLVADRIGYGRLMVLACIAHVLSAVLQLSTGQVFAAFGGGLAGKNAAYWNLAIAMMIFSIGNGTCEVVVNPMVATLFPKEKTHYLNILHAGWPAGLVTGGLLSVVMNAYNVHWMIQMSMFLIPVAIYALMLLGQRMPRSEAHEAGISYGTMFLAIASPVFVLLIVIHAMLGYVELGTDSWIGKITGTIMQVKSYGLMLFVYTSLLMFALRFFAGPIVEKISPLGLLFASGILGAIGLTLLGYAPTSEAVGATMAILFCVGAATVYAVGKTFLWPTMLAVASERFPKGGAIAIGALGAAGMLSAGLLGGPGIGFNQDYYRSSQLKQDASGTYDRYKAENPNTFLVFRVQGLDNAKTAILDDAMTPSNSDDFKFHMDELNRRLAPVKEGEENPLKIWWQGPVPSGEPAEEFKAQDKPPIDKATLYGGQMALAWTAMVPATMAVLYLLLLVYFWTQGGYKAVGVHEQKEPERGEAGTYGEEPPLTPQ